MPKAGNHILIYGTKGKIEVFNGVSEKSIKKIVITTDKEEVIEYEEENLYKNEVENFIKYYLEKNMSFEKGTLIEEQLVALKLIDDLRNNS